MASFYLHGLTLIPAWVSNYINHSHHKGRYEITYSFPNFSTLEVCEGMNNSIQYFTGHAISYPYNDLR